MKRTQIYLTPQEGQGIARVAAATGKKRSEIVREAIDEYLKRLGPQDRLGRLRAGRGIWKDRTDINLGEMRKDFDRY